MLSSLEANLATKALTAGQVEERIATQLNSTEDAKAITQKLIKSGIISTETNSTSVLTAKILEQATADGVLSTSEALAIANALGLTLTNGMLSISFNILLTSIWATIKAFVIWLATNPAGWAIAAVGAIIGLVKIVDLLSVTVEEQREKLENLKQEYSEITSELESLNSELSTIKQRMRELEKIESPTFAEKEEYDNLVKTNNELQRKIDLLELEENIKSKSARKAFVSTMEKDTDEYRDNNDEYFYYIDPNDPYQQRALGKGSSLFYSIGGFRIKAVPEDELISVYEKYVKRLKELDEKYANDLENSTYKKTRKTVVQEMEDLAAYLQGKSRQWTSDSNGIKYIETPTSEDDKAVNEWLDYIADFQDRMAISMGGDNAKINAFNRIVDNWYFDDTVQKLQDLGKQGQVTAEMLNNSKYNEFINKLVFLGFIDSADNLDDIALAFNNVADAVVSVDSPDKLHISFPTILSQIQSLSEGLEQLDSIYTDIHNKEDFDWSSILGNEKFTETFGEMGEAYDNFIRTVSNAPDDLESCQSAFDDLVTSYIYSAKDADGNSIMGNLTDETKEATLAMLEQAGIANALDIVEHQLIRNGESLAGAKKELAAVCGQLSKSVKSETDAKFLAKLSATDLADATFAETISLINEANACDVSAQHLVSLALSKLDVNNYAINSGEDINSLLSLAEAAGITTKAVGKLAGLKAAYEDAVGRGSTNEALAIAAEIETAAEEAQKDILNFKPTVRYGGGSGYRSAIDSMKNDAVKTAEETAEEIEDTAKEHTDAYLEYMKSSLEAGRTDYRTYANDVSAFLRNMFAEGKISAKEYHDYVGQMLEEQKSILDRVSGAVTSRLDKEIDSLNDKMEEIEENYSSQMEYLDTVIEYHEKQKEILQDENEELDRQKALEEALYSLQRAQNQRTTALYTAGKGKIYVADASAVRDAEDSARKAKLDMELAKIDEAIEKVEKQQEALKEAMEAEKKQLQAIIDRLEEYKKQWSSVADEYEDIQNDMLARQVLGADYESKILDGRLDVLNSLRDEYLSIQKAITDAAWESAKAQLEASQAAQNTSSPSTSTPSASSSSTSDTNSGSKDKKTSTDNDKDGDGDKKWYIYDKTTDKRLSGAFDTQAEAAKYLNTYAANTPSHRVKLVNEYASGTRHARRGLNLVGEEGTETYIDNDGNVSLVTKPSLINMEGGETVIRASETEKLLDNGHKLTQRSTMAFAGLHGETVHLTMNEWKNRLQSVMPDFANMVQIPKIQTSKDDWTTVSRDINVTVNNGDIHLHEVQNVDGFAKAIIRELPNKVIQNLGKR